MPLKQNRHRDHVTFWGSRQGRQSMARRRPFTCATFSPAGNRQLTLARRVSARSAVSQLNQQFPEVVRERTKLIQCPIASLFDATNQNRALTLTPSSIDPSGNGMSRAVGSTGPVQICASIFRPFVNYLTGNQRPDLATSRHHCQPAEMRLIANTSFEKHKGWQL